MDQTFEFIRGICIGVSLLLLAGAVMIRWFQRSQDEPRVLALKLVITSFVLAATLGSAAYLHKAGQAFVIWPFIAVFCGIVLSYLWTPNIGSWLAKPLTDMLDGGHEPLEPKPFYSVARALRAKGNYPASVAEVERQLKRFPDDFEGQMLLAEIQAENLHDLPTAIRTIEGICLGKKSTAQDIAAALNTRADWHLKHAKDHEAARRDLQRIAELFPNSEAALGAAQRIAHLGAEEKPWLLHERRQVLVPEGVKSYGLVKEQVNLAPDEVPPERRAAEYVKHLEQHPLDAEAREKLALIYADHYQRLDMATGQLEQLLAQPNAPARNVAHWLNLLADLQIRCANDYDAARRSLQRIVDRFPNLAAAELAHNRMELLHLECKAKGKSQAVKLGAYEQNIGLKYGPPPRG